MSFKLLIEINEDGSHSVDFNGEVNHVILLGILESIKHDVLITIDAMKAQKAQSMLAAQQSEQTKDRQTNEG